MFRLIVILVVAGLATSLLAPVAVTAGRKFARSLRAMWRDGEKDSDLDNLTYSERETAGSSTGSPDSPTPKSDEPERKS